MSCLCAGSYEKLLQNWEGAPPTRQLKERDSNGLRVTQNLQRVVATQENMRQSLCFLLGQVWAETPKTGNHTFVHQVSVHI